MISHFKYFYPCDEWQILARLTFGISLSNFECMEEEINQGKNLHFYLVDYALLHKAGYMDPKLMETWP